MKLYDSKVAPNPRRVRIFLAEKGVSIPTEQIDIGQRDQKSEAFTQLNPLQTAPVLVLDDGTAISESVAICRYIEETHPQNPLFGTDALSRAQVEMWNRRCELAFQLPVQFAFRHAHPAMKELEVPQIPEMVEPMKQKALAFLAIANAQLAKSEFIAGPSFSIADITLLCAVDWMKPARIALPEGLAHVRRWSEAVSARPSASA